MLRSDPKLLQIITDCINRFYEQTFSENDVFLFFISIRNEVSFVEKCKNDKDLFSWMKNAGDVLAHRRMTHSNCFFMSYSLDSLTKFYNHFYQYYYDVDESSGFGGENYNKQAIDLFCWYENFNSVLSLYSKNTVSFEIFEDIICCLCSLFQGVSFGEDTQNDEKTAGTPGRSFILLLSVDYVYLCFTFSEFKADKQVNYYGPSDHYGAWCFLRIKNRYIFNKHDENLIFYDYNSPVSLCRNSGHLQFVDFSGTPL